MVFFQVFLKDEGTHAVPVEIKSSKTVIASYFKELSHFKNLTKQTHIPAYIIYGGTNTQRWPNGTVVSWQAADNLIKSIRIAAK